MTLHPFNFFFLSTSGCGFVVIFYFFPVDGGPQALAIYHVLSFIVKLETSRVRPRVSAFIFTVVNVVSEPCMMADCEKLEFTGNYLC